MYTTVGELCLNFHLCSQEPGSCANDKGGTSFPVFPDFPHTSGPTKLLQELPPWKCPLLPRRFNFWFVRREV